MIVLALQPVASCRELMVSAIVIIWPCHRSPHAARGHGVLAWSCRQVGTDLTHAMLAFEFSGGWNDMKGSVAVTVLQFLLGGGGSFSAGGPGTWRSQEQIQCQAILLPKHCGRSMPVSF